MPLYRFHAFRESIMRTKIVRSLQLLAAGAITLQATGCTPQEFNEFLQTVFLGITAAGSYAILQNL